jgi:pyruvate kinase
MCGGAIADGVAVAQLAGVHVDMPVLGKKDIVDLQQFCVKNNMDFVAASFVQVGGLRGHCLRHPVSPACK